MKDLPIEDELLLLLRPELVELVRVRRISEMGGIENKGLTYICLGQGRVEAKERDGGGRRYQLMESSMGSVNCLGFIPTYILFVKRGLSRCGVWG